MHLQKKWFVLESLHVGLSFISILDLLKVLLSNFEFEATQVRFVCRTEKGSEILEKFEKTQREKTPQPF